MQQTKGSGMISRTIILGMLAQGQMHGYEIRKRILQSLGEAADINFGSIYYGLKSLADKGLVDFVGEEPGQGSPERSVYRITPKGLDHLQSLVEKSLADTSTILSPVEVGLRFLDSLPDGRVREVLDQRYRDLKAAYEQRLSQREGQGDGSSDDWQSFIREYRLYLLGAEVHWLKNLLPRLQKP